jgi:hypothetical protein
VNVRIGLHHTYNLGPRMLGATAIVEQLRALRTAHPELV